MVTRTTDERQTDLLQMLERLRDPEPEQPETGAMDVDQKLRNALGEALRRCRSDRFEVAAQMSRLLDQPVTKWQLDSWTAESKPDHRFPASYLPAFCAVVGSWRPLKVLAEAGGHQVHTDPHVDIAAEIGRLDAEIREEETRLKAKRAQLKSAVETWTSLRGEGV